VHRVDTEDGASVVLHRHPHDGPPVLVVHGISTHHGFWDLTPERSLARALTAAGFDAWLLDLRGHGLAETDANGRPQKVGWTVDDYGRYDLPAAIAHVRAQTGAETVGYVGHSMGGMVAAVYQAMHGDDALNALVVVGSPMDFAGADPLLELARVGMGFGGVVPRVPSELAGRVAAQLPRLVTIDSILYQPDNVDEATRLALYTRGASPLTRGELKQFGQAVDQGRFASMDGEIDYLEALERLRVPLLVIAGRADHIAPVDRVRPYYEAAGSAEKRFVVAGRAEGFSHDYGHCDLGMGNTAPTETFPLVIDWLKR